MRIFTILIFLMFTVSAIAQSPARPRPKDLTVVEDIPSPPDVKATEASKTETVTTRKSGTDTIEEYRLGGKLYKQRIQPAVGPAYYLVDEKGEGKFTRVDGPDLKIAVPMWVILSW